MVADNYSIASYKFSALQMRALRYSFWAKLIGKNSRLAVFPEHIQHDHPNRKLSGVMDIQIDQIIGTLNRDSDFDNKFRPLGEHLLDRWVNIFINLNRDSWPPILVHKIGDQYFVEDGHHRVSVARSVGMLFIQAEVWEYPVPGKEAVTCELVCCSKKSVINAYIMG
jgi:hypothetical protein